MITEVCVKTLYAEISATDVELHMRQTLAKAFLGNGNIINSLYFRFISKKSHTCAIIRKSKAVQGAKSCKYPPVLARLYFKN